MIVIVGPAEAAAAAPPSGAMEGMLSRKHEWESTTKKSNARWLVQMNLFFLISMHKLVMVVAAAEPSVTFDCVKGWRHFYICGILSLLFLFLFLMSCM